MAELKEKTRRRQGPLTRTRGTERHKLTSNRLEVLITIVNRGKADFFMDLIQSYDVNMQFSTSARGTADISILNKLGITDTDKTVMFVNKLPDLLLSEVIFRKPSLFKLG